MHQEAKPDQLRVKRNGSLRSACLRASRLRRDGKRSDASHFADIGNAHLGSFVHTHAVIGKHERNPLLPGRVTSAMQALQRGFLKL